MGSYRVSRQAEDDLYRSWLYGLEQWGAEAADGYLDALYQRFSELAAHPRQYPSVDFLREGYRRSVCGRDSIFYRIDDADVEIMAVIGQQDLDEWL